MSTKLTGEDFCKAITARGNDDLCFDGEDLGFTSRGCECCGSSMAGDRYMAKKITAGNEIRDYSVCTDCINYIANGDIPDVWYR